MKIRAWVLLACPGGPLILSGVASAGYVGILPVAKTVSPNIPGFDPVWVVRGPRAYWASDAVGRLECAS